MNYGPGGDEAAEFYEVYSCTWLEVGTNLPCSTDLWPPWSLCCTVNCVDYVGDVRM